MPRRGRRSVADAWRVGWIAGMTERWRARSRAVAAQVAARVVSRAASATWRESSKIWARPAIAAKGSSAREFGREVAAMVRR